MLDGWAAIRQAAADLRQEIRARNKSCADATEWVEAAVEACGLHIVPFSAGKPFGPEVQAALQRWAFCIHVADRLRHDERAVVVAHELGHLRLHRDIDQDLKLDISGDVNVGPPRMPAYSPRERQEVEADAFADELLCPVVDVRDKLIRCHRPEDIAKQFGVPVDLVMRQAARSLLPEDDFGEHNGFESVVLDAHQSVAAHWNSSNLIVDGAPGTGKTTTLAARAAHLLALIEDAGSIAILAPSDRAIGILRAKIPGGSAMWVSTFHALGLDIIRKRPERMGRSSSFRLLDEASALTLLRSCEVRRSNTSRPTGPHVKLPQLLRTIMRCKTASIAPAALEAAAAASSTADADGERIMSAARAYRAYEAALRDADAIDYGDLTAGAAALIKADAAITTAYRSRFEHVLVDEYEEADTGSLFLLDALCGPSTRLWVTGCAGGSIDRFRHVAGGNVEEFTARFAGERIVLRHDFRAGGVMIGAVNWAKPDLTLPTVASGKHPRRSGADAICEAIASACRAGIGHRDQAVLARTHDDLEEIANLLKARGVPILHLGDLWKRDEVENLLAFARIAADVGNADDLIRLARLPRYLDSLHAKTAIWRVRNGRRSIRDRLLRGAVGNARSGRNGLERLGRDIADLPVNADAWTILTSWVFGSRVMAWMMDADTSASNQERRLAVFHVLELARDLNASGAAAPERILAGLRRLGSLNQETAYRKVAEASASIEAVKLMTIHAAKGREFGAVHLWNTAKDGDQAAKRQRRWLVPEGMAGFDPNAEDLENAEKSVMSIAMSRSRPRLTCMPSIPLDRHHRSAVAPIAPRRHTTETRSAPNR